MTEPRAPRCPICKQLTVEDVRPFCSKRCRDVDLGRWLGGNYAIPGGDPDADEDGDGTGLPPVLSSREGD
jgi:uncharacterized protein